MKVKRKMRRLLSCIMAIVMLCGIVPTGAMVANAATSTVSLSSLGKKGSVSYGSKTKSGTWWKMKVSGKEAFCLSLGYTCHSGNAYASEDTHSWNQNTGGEKHGYYAKIIRWYVLNGKRSKRSFVMSQALIWSVSEGRNSETQLKDVIKQVKNNTGYYSSLTVNELYSRIFQPSGEWIASVTYWQKTGNSNSYQKLLTVDADRMDTHHPTTLTETTYYRQRITVKKKDEDGKGLGGIQFTLAADNLDELYSFSVSDRNGVETSADDDNDTSFRLTGYTRDSGRLAYRMTYRLQTMDYYYYPDAELKDMSSDEKKEAKKYLTDELELDEGIDFASDMTKVSAQKLANQEIKDLKDNISNTYTLTEDNTGANKHIVMDPTFAQGVRITLDQDDSWERTATNEWPDSALEVPSEYTKAYITGVTNKYKKASIDVVKIDPYSADKKAHGDASLDGAVFQLYAEQSCINKATVYDGNGAAKTAGTYTVQDSKLVTDYLRSGTTYYLKEIKAPQGYTLANDILPIQVDASNRTAEYTSNLARVEFANTPILGKVAIQKYSSDGETGVLDPEVNTTFQVYLTSKGNYDACDDYERATIKIDSNGYASTGNLYYGTYTVHQVDSGDVDATPVADFQVKVDQNGKVYQYALNNNLFKAYLKIVKQDGKTGKQVLKAGTTYQIYKVTDQGEELVTQSYSNGNKVETIDTFSTDESGEIMTVKPLKSGTYRIYERESASGLHIITDFVEVTINSKADNYESYQDEEGNTHIVVTMVYTNEETYGKLAISKTGEMLSGWDEENHKFVYEDRSLKGAEFILYADGDIVTQDNQGTTWFKDGEEVATITTGTKAEFTSDCKGICHQSVDEEGIVHLTLPLGKYKLKETKTPYGYVFPEDNEWNLEFTWKNSKDEFVINSTKDTDDKGTLTIHNTLAKPSIELFKMDKQSKEAIAGAVFGLYTSHDIYDVDGKKIVGAGTELTTLTTTADGKVTCDMALPFMDEAYQAINETPPAEPVTGGAITSILPILPTLNSGDYYLKEISVPDSYYLDAEPIPIHLEYKDANMKVLSVKCVKENLQTTNEVDKLSVVGSTEIPGCQLVIRDSAGKDIVSWTSGEKDSIKILVSKMDGYCNLKTSFDEKGNLHIGGLFHDKEYTLTETRPADGFVTADSITYRIQSVPSLQGENRSVVTIKGADGTFAAREDDKVVMIDEQTKIRLLKLDAKTGQGLAGAKFTVSDANGNEVMKFVTTEEEMDITGKLVIGQTYTFTETSAPKGFKIAKPVTYLVKDTKDIQKISVTDKRIPKTPHIPQTGASSPVLPMAVGFVAALITVIVVYRKKKKQNR